MVNPDLIDTDMLTLWTWEHIEENYGLHPRRMLSDKHIQMLSSLSAWEMILAAEQRYGLSPGLLHPFHAGVCTRIKEKLRCWVREFLE